jgi:hypothetical protein
VAFSTVGSATRKTAINGGANTKRVRPMKVNEIGSDVPVEPEDLFEMANLYPSTIGLACSSGIRRAIQVSRQTTS